MKKGAFTALIIILTGVVSAGLFFTFSHISAMRQARAAIDEETRNMLEDARVLEESNEELSKQISDTETELSTKDTYNNYYMEYRKEHDDLAAEIEELKKRSEELDEQIEQKKAEIDGRGGEINILEGGTYTLHRELTYICPQDIYSGRYRVEGNGIFTVITERGKVRISQNLDVSYGNAYTFDLAEGEMITVTSDCKVTEIISN